VSGFEAPHSAGLCAVTWAASVPSCIHLWDEVLHIAGAYFCSISTRVYKYYICKYTGLFLHSRKRKLILTWKSVFFFFCLPTTVWFFCRYQKTSQHFELKLIKKKNRLKCGRNVLTLYSNLKSPTNRVVWRFFSRFEEINSNQPWRYNIYIYIWHISVWEMCNKYPFLHNKFCVKQALFLSVECSTCR